MGAAAIVLWTAPEAIIAVYVDIADPANRETVEIARRLVAIAALFQVFDGMLATVGYWGAGFGGGWLLAFPLGYGAVGLWWGLAFGLAVVALLLTLRLHLLGPPLGRATAAVPIR
jgi:MATE family multidrug resistance protein